MQNRILYIVLGVALLIVASVGIFQLVRKKDATSTQTPTTDASPTSSEAPLFSDGNNNGSDPLFSGTPDPNAISNGSTLTVNSKSACPTQWVGQTDTDNDGLPDTVEAIYKTDTNNPDTDGDSYKDGEEVKNGYDPLKPGNARLDSDNDGLTDDQECKWETDTFNPDTDGDSYKDGVEVTNGYDPAKTGDGKGSDALPEKKAQLSDIAIRPNTNSSNYTEGLAGIMLGNTPTNQIGQVKVTPEQVQQTLANAQLNTTLPEAKVSELNIIQTNTPADIKDYLAKIDGMRPTELLDSNTLTTALMNAFYGNTQQLASIRGNLTTYERTLLAVSTPATAVPHQTLLVQITRFLNDRLGVIQTYGKTDPVKAYLAARELQAGLNTNIAKLKTIRDNLSTFVQ